MTRLFASLSTVFPPYQNDGMVIMEGYVQWNSIYRGFHEKSCASNRIRTQASRKREEMIMRIWVK